MPILLIVTVPVFGDMVNATPDTRRGRGRLSPIASNRPSTQATKRGPFQMRDAVLRLSPRWLLERRKAAAEFAARRNVKRAVLALAILLAAAAYVRFMHDIYQGDAHLYWLSIRSAHLYDTALNNSIPQGYLYSPAFVQVLWPLLSLPWEVFYGFWLAILTVTLLWLARPWLSCLLFPPVFITFGIGILLIPRHALSAGNVATLMGLAVVASFRWPWTYAFLLLTKVTPGVGLLWFAVRREWRNLAIALGATAAVVLVSFSFSANLWWDWIKVIQNNSAYPEPSFAYHVLPLVPRLIIASAITIVAARYNARWAMPIVAVLALPYIYDTSLIMLVGIAPLLRHDGWTETRRAGTSVAEIRGTG